MATAAASEAAKAVNSLLRLSSRHQEAMLDVLHEYFTSPDVVQDEDDNDSDEDPADSLIVTKDYYYYY